MLVKTNCLLMTLLTINMLAFIPIAQAKMYRWHDENGKLHFTDKIPPEHARKKRESLSKSARIIKKETVAAAKSKEYLEIQFRLAALQRQQKSIRKKQNSRDRVLLSTFRNVDGIELAYARAIESFDIQQNGIKKQLEFFNNSLQGQQKIAADNERNGKKIAQKTLDKIAQFEQKIALVNTDLEDFSRNKNTDLEIFKTKIERLKAITAIAKQDKAIAKAEAATQTANNLGLYACATPEACDQAWNIAKQFILTYSNTEIQRESNELVLSHSPTRPQDLSLSLTKSTNRNKKRQIFLDIRCHHSDEGKTRCAEPSVKQIRSAFRPYILSQLEPE